MTVSFRHPIYKLRAPFIHGPPVWRKSQIGDAESGADI